MEIIFDEKSNYFYFLFIYALAVLGQEGFLFEKKYIELVFTLNFQYVL